MVESRQDEVLAIVAVSAVLAYIFIGLRVYSRVLGRNFGWDDYLMLMAAVFFFGQTLTIWKCTLCIHQPLYPKAYFFSDILLSGTGYHVYDLPKKSINEQVTAMKWSFATQMMYHPLMFSIRASIIMFLFRMKDNRRRIRWALHGVCEYAPFPVDGTTAFWTSADFV